VTTASLASDFLYSDDYLYAPELYWARLRNDHPLFHEEQAGFWMLSRYDDVVAVLRDHETYSTLPYRRIFRPVIGPTFVEMDGDDHDELRAVVAPSLVGKPLASYRPLVERSVRSLFDRLPSDARIDLKDRLTSRLPLLVIADVLGLQEEDHEFFYGRCAAILHGLEGVEPGLSHGVAAHRELAEHFAPLIDARKASPEDDLVSRIAGAESDGRRLTEDEITSFISLLLVAGGETTDMAIANLWYDLFTVEGLLEEVRDDPALVEHAFSESMRREGAVVYEDRETTRDVEWYGEHIPAGSIVRVCLGAANHDDTVFSDPERFDLHRSDLRMTKDLRGGARTEELAGHLTFGAGKHFCLGYQLARLEAVTATQQLVERLRRARLAGDVDCRPRINFFHRRPDHLVVVRDAAG